MNRISLEDEDLEISVASKTFADKLSGLLLNVAVTDVKLLQDLIAIQKVLDHLKHGEIGSDVIFGDVKFPHFIIGFEADHEFVKALSSDVVAVDVQLTKPHLLVFEHI